MEKLVFTNVKFFRGFLQTSGFDERFASLGVKWIWENSNPSTVFGLVIGAPQRADSALFDTFPNARFVSSFGVGVDHIDLIEAKKRNIIVTHVPQIHRDAAAEMIMAFIFALAKNLSGFSVAMGENIWQKELCASIAGKKLGIIGLGNIGKKTAELAKALGLQVSANDIVYDAKFISQNNIQILDLPELLATSDFISLSVPLTAETRHLINEDNLQQIKPTAFLVNISRGAVIDEQALLEALENKKLAGAALDVFSEEPPFQNEILKKLIQHPKVIATPHVATYTFENKTATCRRICKNLLAVLCEDLNSIDRVV